MPTGGTGTGVAQDATIQAIIAKLGASTPQGGTGTGIAQDASLQALLAVIGSGTPSAAFYALTDIYWDPANSTGLASDSNTGASAVLPLLTFARILQLWATSSPLLTKTTTLHVMSTQVTGTDPVVANPIMLNGADFVILGTPTNVGASFAAGAVTAKVQTAIGHPLKVAGFTSGTHKPGMVVHNTDLNSYATIDSITGGGVATLTQPLAATGLTSVAATPAFVEDNGWDLGDTLQVMSLPIMNFKTLRPSGGDGNAGFTTPTCWVQQIYVPDPGGTPGGTPFAAGPIGMGMTFSLCSMDAFLQTDGTRQTFGLNVAGCWANGSAKFESALCFGGAVNTAQSQAVLTSAESTFDCDMIVHGTCEVVDGLLDIGAAYFDGELSLNSNTCVSLEQVPAAPATILYGQAILNLQGPNSSVQRATASGWASCLKMQTLEFDSVTTGSCGPSAGTFTLTGTVELEVVGVFPANAAISWSLNTVGTTPGTGSPYFSSPTIGDAFFVKSPTPNCNDVYNWASLPTEGITLTSANLDAFNGLFNPRTGNRFCSLT